MEKDNTYYLVKPKILKRLLEDAEKYCALVGGGVDNWSYYGEALRDGIDYNISINPELARHIDTMEEEGHVVYRDNFWYEDLADWKMRDFEKTEKID